MGADRFLISKIINNFLKILLNLALAYGKHLLIRSNISVITIYSDEAVHWDRHSKCSFFLCFLFNDIQAVTSPIHYDVLQMQGEYVLYSHSQISLQCRAVAICSFFLNPAPPERIVVIISSSCCLVREAHFLFAISSYFLLKKFVFKYVITHNAVNTQKNSS